MTTSSFHSKISIWSKNKLSTSTRSYQKKLPSLLSHNSDRNVYIDVITDFQILQTFNVQEVEDACVGV